MLIYHMIGQINDKNCNWLKNYMPEIQVNEKCHVATMITHKGHVERIWNKIFRFLNLNLLNNFSISCLVDEKMLGKYKDI